MVDVHPKANKPTEAWRALFEDTPVGEPRRVSRALAAPSEDEPQPADMLRFVFVSDSHSKWNEMLDTIPSGDVLLHSGDFTMSGTVNEVVQFNEELAKLDHKYKVVIAGNHEFCFDRSPANVTDKQMDELQMRNCIDARQLLTNCLYLEDQEILLFGYRIYGLPWHSMPGYPFFQRRGEGLLKRWLKIPRGVDILLSHMPPLGHGDLAPNKWGERWGDVDLLNVVERLVRPKYHAFGHVHQGYGITENDLGTTFINSCLCDQFYRTVNRPIVIDLPVKV